MGVIYTFTTSFILINLKISQENKDIHGTRTINDLFQASS